jgi:5'-methylthioadenosine phosphorylase
MTMSATLAIIGGSGFAAMPGLTGIETLEIDTPYGAPSGHIMSGSLQGTRVLFLARHGEHHRIPPHCINFRANICALKLAGATHVVSLSAVGSMREHMHPGDVVIVRDYLDLTRRRASTFFDAGVVAHVSMAIPICPLLADASYEAAVAAGARVHRSGTYVCIEGPQFSSRAESLLFRSWNVDVIGMTAMPEAKLAREAELPYVTAAFVTDFDCWNESEVAVSVQQIVTTLQANAALAQKMVAALATRLPDTRTSPAFGALDHAIITPLDHRDRELMAQLRWLLRPSETTPAS